MSVEIRQLQYFRYLARELSFSRAAARAHVSQSSMSEQVMRLEDVLGVKLVDRSRRQIGLTLAGEALRDGVGDLLGNLDDLVAQVRAAGGAPRAILRIGYSEMAVGTTMPSVLHEFRQRFPEVELVLREQSSNGAEEALLDQEFDCVFIPGEQPRSRQIDALVLSDEPVLVCVAATSPLALRRVLRWTDLRDAPIILPEEGSNLAAHVMARFARAGLTPRIVGRAGRALSMMTLVASEAGVAFVPQSLATLSRTDVVFLSLSDAGLHVPFAMMWRREGSKSALPDLAALAREVAAAPPPQPAT